MESEVENAEGLITDKDSKTVKFLWIPFLRQLWVAMGMWTIYFVNGLVIGTPTVMIPQLRRELNNSTSTKFNEDFAPWMSSVFGIAGMPWVIILPVLMERIGRKFTYLIVCNIIIIGYIVFYTGSSVIQLFISEIILSILVPATQTVMVVMMSECTAPQYRGLFLTFKSASFLWGIWAANAIGTLFHFKNIGILAFVCCSYTISVLLWPESPYWLATKGRFEECTDAHRWLKGTDSKSEQELLKLIESQKRESNFVAKEKKLIQFQKMIVLPEFYKPVLIAILVITQYYVSGKLVCAMYAIEILKKISESEATAYKSMLILDGVTVISAYVGSILSKFFRRRTLLISTTSVAILFLFILSLYLYLVKFAVILENHIISISFLTAYSIAVSSGSMILITSIIGEILPLKCKSWSVFVISLFTTISHFAYLRAAPEIFQSFGLHGAFLFYGVGSMVSLILVYIYLPETKGKTLQEIENHFKRSSSSVEESKEVFLKSVDIKLTNKINDVE